MPFLFLDIPDENGVYSYKLEIVDKHPVLRNVLDKRYLIDTGSPISMTVGNEPFLLCGKSFESSTLNIIDTVQELSGLEEVDGLVGLDVLSKFNVFISYKDNVIQFSHEAFQIPGQTVPMHVMPLKSAIIFNADLEGQPISCILDTGAQIDYVISNKLVEGLVEGNGRVVGEAQDFSPFAGRFTTPLYEMSLGVGELNCPVKCGILPASMSTFSKLVGLMGDAVIGYDLLSQFDVAINMCSPDKMLTFK